MQNKDCLYCDPTSLTSDMGGSRTVQKRAAISIKPDYDNLLLSQKYSYTKERFDSWLHLHLTAK